MRSATSEEERPEPRSLVGKGASLRGAVVEVVRSPRSRRQRKRRRRRRRRSKEEEAVRRSWRRWCSLGRRERAALFLPPLGGACTHLPEN